MKALKFLKHMKQTDTPYNFREWELDESIAELEALQSRSCKGCKYLDKGTHGICPIAEPLMRQWLKYNEATFYCNRYEPKDNA